MIEAKRGNNDAIITHTRSHSLIRSGTNKKLYSPRVGNLFYLNLASAGDDSAMVGEEEKDELSKNSNETPTKTSLKITSPKSCKKNLRMGEQEEDECQ